METALTIEFTVATAEAFVAVTVSCDTPLLLPPGGEDEEALLDDDEDKPVTELGRVANLSG